MRGGREQAYKRLRGDFDMITFLLAVAAQSDQFELVVRFPGNNMGYQRVYRSALACNKARNVILVDHKERVAEQDRAVRARGGVLVPGPPPVAICIPL